MVDIEEISAVALQVITYAGMAKSCYMESLAACKKGDDALAQAKRDEGEESFAQAHKAHAGLLKKEMKQAEPQISLLMAHAEDQLMGCETIRVISDELIELHRQVR